ncbi:Hypothetical protein CINCED_3A021290 [Cinara cedri]|uniref:Uncharacterized protein n=1 Tax=Cinara cedri TaxID=506608 RepID=A0A5E4M1I7_9HEMI|nr:Hypothetical protein CINCED_3A021290 [Cinara cedri]
MQIVTVTAVCLISLAIRSVSGHTINQNNNRAEDYDRDDWKEPRALKTESVLMGIAKSLIGGKIGSTGGGQSLSLNMSNIVLMLVLRGLIWGVSYMQGDGGKEARNEDATSAGGLLDDAITETDVMLFLGYLVADESGHSGCLNRVACEQPDRADGYFRAAETVWRTAKMFDGAVPLDAKYETILAGLHEAIEDGRAVGGDCRSKYKCFGSHTSDDADRFNLT